jgi:hypothetical protein
VRSCNGGELKGWRVVRVASCKGASGQGGELSRLGVVRVVSCQGGELPGW